MKMRTLNDLIKHHGEREMRARTIGGTVGHFDAKQTLKRCLELPATVVGPFGREWAMETLAEVFREAAQREALSPVDPAFPEDAGLRDQTINLLNGMADAAIDAATRDDAA